MTVTSDKQPSAEPQLDASNAIETSGPRSGESLFNWVVRTMREQAEAMQEKGQEKWIN